MLPGLYIAVSPGRGRGVFTSADIEAGTVVETSPVVVMSHADRVHLDQTLLHDYIFEWGRDKKQCCMALGYVAVYNHSYQSNCEYEMDFEGEQICIRAVHFIRAGSELFVNYNGVWDDNRRVWFDKK